MIPGSLFILWMIVLLLDPFGTDNSHVCVVLYGFLDYSRIINSLTCSDGFLHDLIQVLISRLVFVSDPPFFDELFCF